MSVAARRPAQGLDLQRWYPSIRPLVLRKYAAWLREAGLDVEDVVQEVARRVLVANGGEHPYDASRCAPAVYLLIQARSAIGHLAEARRRWDRELPTEEVDAPALLEVDGALDRLTDALSHTDAERPVVRLYLEGHRREEIEGLLQMGRAEVEAVICAVRVRAARYPKG